MAFVYYQQLSEYKKREEIGLYFPWIVKEKKTHLKVVTLQQPLIRSFQYGRCFPCGRGPQQLG